MNEGFIFSVGGGATLPVVSFAASSLAAGAASGSAAGQASCSGGYAGSWSLSTTAPLAVNASTGVLTTTGAVSQGAYSATLVYTFASGGETYTVSEPISVVVAAAPVAAPTFTTAPSLSTSSPVVGSAIAATAGVYTGSPTVTRQWFYGDTGIPISGATGTSYTPVSADAGHTLKYIETATNAAGSVASAAPTTSAVQAAASHTADQTSTTADRTALTADAA